MTTTAQIDENVAIDLEWKGVRFVGTHALTSMKEFVRLSSESTYCAGERLLVHLDEGSAVAFGTQDHDQTRIEVRITPPSTTDLAEFQGVYLDDLENYAVVVWRGVRQKKELPENLRRAPTANKLAFASAFLALCVRNGQPSYS